MELGSIALQTFAENLYNFLAGFGHTDTRWFCWYHTYCLDDSCGDKGGQSGILMQYGAKKPRSTLAVYGIATNCVLKTTSDEIALLYTALKRKCAINIGKMYRTLRANNNRVSQSFGLETMLSLLHGSR